jgi:hypothetical protein
MPLTWFRDGDGWLAQGTLGRWRISNDFDLALDAGAGVRVVGPMPEFDPKAVAVLSDIGTYPTLAAARDAAESLNSGSRKRRKAKGD